MSDIVTPAVQSRPGRQRTPETVTHEVVAPGAVARDTITPDPVALAWSDYLAAARQLDGVRRAAATAAVEQARSVQAAREELTEVRARLAPQQSRLQELGVPPISLVPSPPELSEAARSMAAGPSAVLAALRTARGLADAADGVLTARGVPHPATWPPRLRNLLVYGPLALLVPVLQLVVLGTTGTGAWTVAALLCGLPMPAAAFAAGWVGTGLLFRRAADESPEAGGHLDRTPRFGALVCLIPAVLSTAGIVVALLGG